MVTPPSTRMPLERLRYAPRFPNYRRLVGGQRDTARNNRLASGLRQPDKQVSRRGRHVRSEG